MNVKHETTLKLIKNEIDNMNFFINQLRKWDERKFLSLEDLEAKIKPYQDRKECLKISLDVLIRDKLNDS